MNLDVVTVQTKHIANVHNSVEKYSPKTEFLFSFVQILTSSFASFTHGSNDLSNAIGPVAGIYSIWQTSSITSKVEVPRWLFVYGAFALVLGFLTFGHHVMRTLGNNITFHSPSRGFCMEFGASITVISASYIGLPVSTTHCITGATAAVGISNGTLKAVNWRVISWCLFSWIITVPIAGTISGAIFAFVIYSPLLYSYIFL